MIICSILVLLFFFICIYCFGLAVVRGKELDLADEHAVKGTAWEPYTTEIQQGVAWIEAQHPERVSITSRDGLRLAGHYLDCNGAKRVILLMHGYRSKGKNDFSCVAKFYFDQGYSLLFVDQRAHGESEGKYIGFGVLERYDCLKWIEYILRRFGPDTVIFLGGISMGATTVLMASGLELPENVKGIIADCGFTFPWDIIACVMKRDYHLPKIPILPVMSLISKLIAGYGFRDASTEAALQKNKVPVLFVHGTADGFVPCEMTKRNYEYCIAEKKLLLIDGADHGTSYIVNPDLCKKELVSFLKQYG